MNKKTAYKKRMTAFASILKNAGKIPSPRLAFNFLNFQDYKHNFLSDAIGHPAQVCVFEQLIMLSHIFIKNHGRTAFFHTAEQLEKGTGLSRKTVSKILVLLEAKGVVSRNRATTTSKTYFKLDYPKLMKCYRSFLDPTRIEDDEVRSCAYNERLKYFAFMNRLCKAIEDLDKTTTHKQRNAGKPWANGEYYDPGSDEDNDIYEDEYED
jgi:hypothetical protein